jgi:WD40 repeat protein
VARQASSRTRNSSGAYGYDAFVSYSHAADGRLAPALQDGLQSLAKPWYRRRALRVFRDQTSLTATPELWGSIEQALAAAHFFILLASPDAAASPWVQREVAWWRQNRSNETLLIVLTHGTLAWNPSAGDFDWSRTDALPEGLSGLFVDEPLWVDLRWTYERKDVPLDDPRLRDSIATLAAPVRDEPKDALIGKDLQEHRRARRLAWAAAISLLVLAVAATGSAITAVGQRNDARQQARIATSRALASAATSVLPDRVDTGLLLAAEARRMQTDPQTEAALMQAALSTPHLSRLYHQSAQVTALTTDSARVIVSAADDGSLRAWDARSGSPLWSTAGTGIAIRALALSSDGTYAISGDDRGRVALHAFRDGRRLWLRDVHGGPIVAVAMSHGGGLIAAAAREGPLALIGTEDGVIRARTSSTLSEGVTQVAFEKRDEQVMVGDPSGRTGRWRSIDLAPINVDQYQQAPFGGFLWAYSTDGAYYAYLKQGRATVINTRTGELHSTAATPSAALLIAVAPGGRRLAVGTDDGITVIDTSPPSKRDSQPWTRLSGVTGSNQLITFEKSGRRIVSAAGQVVALWDLDQRSRLAQVLPPVIPDKSELDFHVRFALQPHGHMLVWQEEKSVWEGPGWLVCWDSAKATLRARIALRDTILGLAFRADGDQLVTGGDQGFDIWDTSKGCPQHVQHFATSLYNVAYLDANHLIASTPTEDAAMLDLRTGELTKVLLATAPQDRLVLAWHLSSDNRTLVLGRVDGSTTWLDLHTGRSVDTVDHRSRVIDLAVDDSGDGLIASAEEDGAVVISSAATHRIVRRLSGSATRLAFSRDGEILVGVGSGAIARVWDVHSGSLLATFQTQQPPLADTDDVAIQTTLAFDEEGGLWIATPSSQVIRWALSTSDLMQSACRTAGRDLSDAEWRQSVGTEPPKNLSCLR